MADQERPLADDVRDLRNSIGSCLLGETLGDGHGTDVLKVADVLIRYLHRYGWTFVRGERTDGA